MTGKCAEAGLHLHGSTGSIVPLANRKVQVGINIDGSTFKNFMLTANASSTGAYQQYLNIDQYPVGALPQNIGYSVLLPSNLTTNDVCVLAWTGTVPLANDTGGALSVGGAPITVVPGGDPGGVVVGGTTFSMRCSNPSTTSGYVEFKFGTLNFNANLSISFVFAPATYPSGATKIQKLILCRKSDYAAIVAATQPQDYYNADFINAVKALSPKTIRLLGFIGAIGYHTQHRYRLGWNTALSFATTYWLPQCWAGGAGGFNNITSSDGLNYVAAAATDTPAALTHGEVIQGQISMTCLSSGAMSLNVGGRGVKPIFRTDGVIAPNNIGPFGSTTLTAGNNVTFIYDDILDAWIYLDNNDGYGWTGANTPIELQVGLANAVGCNLWYQMCAKNTFKNSTMEGGSNSVAQQVSYLKINLTNGCYLEYGNELFNTAPPFNRQTSWAHFCGLKWGFGTTFPSGSTSFYGYMMTQAMSQAKTLWFPRIDLHCVNSWQLGGAVATEYDQQNLRGRFLAPNGTGTGGFGTGNAFWGTYTGNADFTTKPNRPVDFVDSLSYAPYYSGSQLRDFQETYSNAGGIGLTTGGPPGWTTGAIGAADAYFAGGTTNINNAMAFVDWDLRQGTQNRNVTITGDGQTFTIGNNVFAPANGGPVTFSAPGGTMFAGITAGVTYYCINRNDAGNPPGNSTFQVSTTVGGAAVTGISGGTGCLVAVVTGLTLAFVLAYYAATEALCASFDTDRPAGAAALTVDCYEGSAQPTIISNLTFAYALGLYVTSGITLNVGTSPAVSWTGHGLDNGALVGISVNITDTNFLTTTGWTTTGGSNRALYVANKTTNGFDLAYAPGGPTLTIQSVAGGTQTGYGSNYAGGADRFANLLKAYRQTPLFQATVKSQYDSMFALAHTSTCTWFTMNTITSPNQWSMFYGDVYSTPRFTSYDAVAAYHS